MERLEDLQIKGYKIYQDDELYRFTSDSVLLSRFARVKKGDKVADFCAGSGIVGIHLYALSEKIDSVTLFEMQPELCALSTKSINLNQLEDKFKVVNTRVQDIESEYAGAFSLITCNPPYMETGRGEVNASDKVAMCKNEIYLPLKELIKSISYCLKFGGRTAICHRADRLCDIITEMRKNNIEPKRLQFVSGGNKEPYLLLIEGVKGGKNGIKILKETTN